MKLLEVAVVPERAFVEVNTSLVHVAFENSRKVTVPVGLNPPLTVAVSVTAVPIGPPGEAMVEMVGLALVMVTDSLGAWHGEAAGLLLTSPLYTAVQKYVPGAVGVKLPEVDVPPATGLVDVKTSVEQVEFENSRNVTVPVGLKPPVRVALSVTAVPIGPSADAMVEMAGLAMPIVADSFGALHGEMAGSLLASPL